MNGLIETYDNGDGTVAIDGRDLHKFLEVNTPYTKWMDRMIDYGFVENVDFTVLDKNVHDESVFGNWRKLHDHALTLDMAKELSMIQRTEKGKQARQYFIAMEKRAKQPQLPTTPAEKIKLLLQNSDEANQRITQVEQQVIDLRDHQPLAPGEYNYISKQVNHAVADYVAVQHLSLTRDQRALLYKDINNGVRVVTGVHTRTQLRKQDFNTADEFIHNWTPSTATLQLIRQLDSETADQLRMDV